MKRILITGANSYIGDSVKAYLERYKDEYKVDIKDTIGWKPVCTDFSGYDVVLNVAGIAHIKESKKNRHLYYDINRDLAVDIAKNAKEAGVGQFIVMSSMSVYGNDIGVITKTTKPHPKSHYGKSKLEADRLIWKTRCDGFRVAILRPPMVYGDNCKGNYKALRIFALKSPVFPEFGNRRSMIYIGNLCEFVKNVIDKEWSGLFFPQNEEYVDTTDMVKLIAQMHDKMIITTKVFNWAIRLCRFSVVKKVFGNLVYEKVDTIGEYSFEESIRLSERKNDDKKTNSFDNLI